MIFGGPLPRNWDPRIFNLCFVSFHTPLIDNINIVFVGELAYLIHADTYAICICELDLSQAFKAGIAGDCQEIAVALFGSLKSINSQSRLHAAPKLQFWFLVIFDDFMRLRKHAGPHSISIQHIHPASSIVGCRLLRFAIVAMQYTYYAFKLGSDA